MKNKLSTKVVAVLLAAVLLLSSGIMSALPGIDFGSLLELKASAEDPKNDLHYDKNNGLFFFVEEGAMIVGTDPADLVESDNYKNSDQSYTIPSEVKDTKTGLVYKVFGVRHLAFLNSDTKIKKLIIPDHFRKLMLDRSAFAGLSTLSEVQFDCSNAVISGPLFELVTTYDWQKPDSQTFAVTGEDLRTVVYDALGPDCGYDGALEDLSVGQRNELKFYCDNHNYDFDMDNNVIRVKLSLVQNCFPKRNDEGVLVTENDSSIYFRFFPVFEDQLIISENQCYDSNVYIKRTLEGSTATEADVATGTDSGSESFAERKIIFKNNLQLITQINEISKLNYDGWTFEATVEEHDVSFYEDTEKNVWGVGIYENATEEKIQVIDGVTHNITVHRWRPLYENGVISIVFNEVDEITPDNIIDGNGDISKSNTVILYKSPVTSIKVGENVKNIPDYLFFDANVGNTDIKNAVDNAETIGKYAFADCDYSQSIDLTNVKKIGDCAFAACDGIKKVELSKDLEELGSGAFMLCDDLSEAIINSTDCKVSDSDPAPFTDSGLTKITFGKYVSTIPSNIAKNVDSLREVIFLADSLVIEDNAFSGSESIHKIETKEEKTLDGAEIKEGNETLLYSDITVSKHQHDPQSKTYPPTCSSEGYTVNECICGYIEGERRDVIGTIGHTPTFRGEEKPLYVEETCTEKGYYKHTCEICGTIWKSFNKTGFPEIKDSEIAKSEDDYSHDWKATGSKGATCSEAAYEEQKCSKCNETRKVYESGSEPLGHDWVNRNTVAPGCETIGYTVQACSRCGATQNVDEQPANGHSWSAWTYHNNATVDSDGTRTRTCLVCGKSVTETAEGTKINDPLRDIHMYFGPGAEVDYSQEVIVVAKTSQDLPSGYTLVICEGSETLGETTSSSLEVNLGKVKSDRHLTAKIVDANDRVVRNSRNITFYKDLVVKVKTGFFNRLIALIKGFFRLLPVKKIGATALVK